MMILFYFAAFVVTLIVRGVVAIFSVRTRTDIAKHPYVHAVLLAFVLMVFFFPRGFPVEAMVGNLDVPNIYGVNLQEKPKSSKRWAYTIYFDPNTD